ncbi:hypothetical protein K7432_002931 [Basidiobolus ranarum]|uniref:Altered inheritance of mitochondria protein 32 n=1 Tax=Basidiobolus ranarum TaxID=34480 RepID=A0ABR2X0S3_9FUNG
MLWKKAVRGNFPLSLLKNTSILYGKQSVRPLSFLNEFYETKKDDCSDKCSCQSIEYPPGLDIDTESPLPNISPYSAHFLVSTGHSKWPSKVEFIPNTLTSLLSRSTLQARKKQPTTLRVINSNTDRPITDKSEESTLDSTQLVVYPNNWLCSNVNEDNISSLVNHVLLDEPIDFNSVGIKVEPFKKSQILICGHMERDARCGIVAPILKEAFEKAKKTLGLEDQIEVNLVSHIGGHKYAANVILYPAGIWYARVRPEHAEEILVKSIQNQEIIPELYRG